VARGFTLEQIVRFSFMIRPLLLSSMEELPGDVPAVEQQLLELFREAKLNVKTRSDPEFRSHAALDRAEGQSTAAAMPS
jgi:hypothetical protein